MARRPTRAQRDAARRQVVDVSDAVADLADGLVDDLEDATEQIAWLIKQAGYDTAGRAVGRGDPPMMSNVGRNGLHLGIRYTVTGPGKAYLHFVPTALWAWLEEGTRRHSIPRTRKTRRGKDPKTVFMKADGAAHPVRGPIKHPGWRNPPRSFTRTLAQAEPIALEVLSVRAGLVARDQGWS